MQCPMNGLNTRRVFDNNLLSPTAKPDRADTVSRESRDSASQTGFLWETTDIQTLQSATPVLMPVLPGQFLLSVQSLERSGVYSRQWFSLLNNTPTPLKKQITESQYPDEKRVFAPADLRVSH